MPTNVDILNPFFLNGIDVTSWKSLSGVRANNSILELVPDVKIFQELLCCVKLWAKVEGCMLFGFFGCQRNPAMANAMMPPPHPSETRALMPIQLPSSPHEYYHSNITTSTIMKIKNEFQRGYRYNHVWRSCLFSMTPTFTNTWIQTYKAQTSFFYWGLLPGRSNYLDLDLLQKEFTRNLVMGYKGLMEKMTLSIIQAFELPKSLHQLVDTHQLFSNSSKRYGVPNSTPHYFLGYLAPEYRSSGIMG
ncbi:Poly(A) polymerase, central domain-containing protein [Cynara cardunculus var. scolymus]|uniref:Poly(A) polymerase, central domain-containing protein n=1 Tax=Cynara cardunculus var. scolymus TaxID=59895 RepID=A0A103XGC7_CYNCS|nr:Poly(A) polymerase, central domain-containing protein [Cynara cardunculus var. scolymus]